MANKAIQFILRIRRITLGKNKGKDMQLAVPTDRRRVDARNFFKAVAKNTTFSEREVAAVINEAVSTARDFVANGETVEFGDMGTLVPSFKSKMVEKGTPFNANVHILKPTVGIRFSRKYFELEDVSFEQVTPRVVKEPKLPPKP